jgi:uncharacterized protein YbjT (DUF2867 family)
MATVLVTAATGTVGSGVVRELVARGVDVRAFVRDPARAAALLGDGVQLAVGDLGDPSTVRRALEGVDRMFLNCGNVPGQVEMESAAVTAAAEAGVERLVKLSTIGAEAGSPLLFWDWQGCIEDHLRASGLPAVVLRANFFMTALLASAGSVRHAGAVFAPAAGARVSMVDPADVSAAAAGALAADDGAEGVHVVTGPEAVSWDDIARHLSAATGRPVAFVDVPDDAAREAMVGDGLPPFVADFLVGAFRVFRAGGASEVTDTVQALAGRPPRSVADYLRAHAAVFGAGGPGTA